MKRRTPSEFSDAEIDRLWEHGELPPVDTGRREREDNEVLLWALLTGLVNEGKPE